MLITRHYLIISVFFIILGAASASFAERAPQSSPRPTLNLHSLDFLSDDYLCGLTTSGNIKCYDWNMADVALPDTVVGFRKPSDVIASYLGTCGFDVDGLKCIEEDRRKVVIRDLMAESIPTLISTKGNAACGVNALNGSLRCLVPEWTSYSRRSFRIQPRNKITAIGVSDYLICWADGELLNCLSESGTRSMKFSGAVEIISHLYVCARSATEAKCWTNDFATEVVMAPEFLTAKKWFADNYQTIGAIAADNRFISLDFMTGNIDTTGALNVPPMFEQPGNPLTDVWAGEYNYFCALSGVQSKATCWFGYAPSVSEIKFSGPVFGFTRGGNSAPCVLLQTGQIECANQYEVRTRSIRSAGPIHARLATQRSLFWNEVGMTNSEGVSFPFFEKFFSVETDLDVSQICAVGSRTGSNLKEVACKTNGGLEPVPQATEGATSISVAADKACAISPIGLTCWGKDYAGEPRPSSFLDPVKVQLANEFACALDHFGLVCWGDLATNGLHVPSGLNSPGAIVDFALGQNRACGLLANGTIQCWGAKLADDEDPPTLTDVTAIFGSRQHVFCATNPSGLHCWGGDTMFPR